MSSFTDSEEVLVLEDKYRSEALELALHTASPNENGSVANEVGVPREPIAFTDPSVSRPISNDSMIEVDFSSQGSDTTVTHISIHRQSDGSMISYAIMSSSVIVPAGQLLRIPAGAITAEID